MNATISALPHIFIEFVISKIFPSNYAQRSKIFGHNSRSIKAKQDLYIELDKAFLEKEDQWNFEHSSYEQRRYLRLLSLAKSVPHAKILEFGCAEGNFTKHLTTISTDITAIDIVPTAIQRAKKMLPNVKFKVGRVENFTTNEYFDLIVCPETLYYIDDEKTRLNVIRNFKNYGKYLLTSHFLLDPNGRNAESSLTKLYPIHRSFIVSVTEQKLALIGLWNLSK